MPTLRALPPTSPPPPRAPLPRHGRNPAFYCALLGCGLLGLTFWLPLASAQRTARTEQRGDRLAELLLRVAAEMQPLDLDAAWVPALLHARLLRAAGPEVFVEDLELLPHQAPGSVTFANKHYLIQLRWSTSAERAPGVGTAAASAAPLPLEALAWPREATGPAHAVFFCPEDAEPAYTRNLVAGYVGEDPAAWPRPGHAHRRPDGNQQVWSYRGHDDEHWVLRDRPTRGRPPGDAERRP